MRRINSKAEISQKINTGGSPTSVFFKRCFFGFECDTKGIIVEVALLSRVSLVGIDDLLSPDLSEGSHHCIKMKLRVYGISDRLFDLGRRFS